MSVYNNRRQQLRIEILHTANERSHAEHIRHLVALQLGPEVEIIDVSLREDSCAEGVSE